MTIKGNKRRGVLKAFSSSLVGLSGFGVTGSATGQRPHQQSDEPNEPAVLTSVEFVDATLYGDVCASEANLQETDASFTVEGDILSNGRWQVTTAELHLPDNLPVDSFEITTESRGIYVPNRQLVTVSPVFKTIQGTTESAVKPLFTTATSGAMKGEATHLDTETPSVTLVANEFGMDLSGGIIPPPGCSYSPLGRNWLKMEADLQIEDAGSLTEIGPVPLTQEFNMPQDLDGDGLHENVQGDGEFDVADVQTLHDNLDSPAIQEYSAFYDFSETNPHEVTVFDVQALFSRL